MLDTTATDEPDLEPPEILRELVAKADVRFNGDAPWDIQVHDRDVYRRILSRGSLGFGEAYMAGLWDTEQLDVLFYHLLKHDINEEVRGWTRLRLLAGYLRNNLLNPQSHKRAFQVAWRHYDIGNDVFRAMLDPTMSYSCGYWQDAETLDQAQQNKLDLVCRKLELRPGEQLLEIGCGWGGLARHAALNYGVSVVGITVSKEQKQYAENYCAGLPVEIRLQDYRDIQGQFDKIVSVGMFEHVGPKNYRTYFRIASRLLADEGLFLLHTIGDYKTTPATDPWIEQYIFPNGKLPSITQLTAALEGVLAIEDWHNFGQDYDRTLLAWWHNFDTAWPELSTKYNESFYRMFHYYLMSCAGMFRARQAFLWQLVLSKRHRRGVYRSVR